MKLQNLIREMTGHCDRDSFDNCLDTLQRKKFANLELRSSFCSDFEQRPLDCTSYEAVSHSVVALSSPCKSTDLGNPIVARDGVDPCLHGRPLALNLVPP